MNGRANESEVHQSAVIFTASAAGTALSLDAAVAEALDLSGSDAGDATGLALDDRAAMMGADPGVDFRQGQDRPRVTAGLSSGN